MINLIKKKIQKQIKVKYLKIYNTSFMHPKLKNNNSHFKIIIVSQDFLKINILRRHQIIYNILSKELKKVIHGIEIFTYTFKEWIKKKKNKISYIQCKK
ncbi:BolA family protein [Buchnera aphidicola]|uniref:BolA family protein n=1 Tax=Buchnera aphidicola TaxID=9 RepID=UPI0022384A12|nr:BolA family protein [Buchnera aphidicola]MCW5197525.1 BolA family transcriptional regulator [Buchnera aphidicola (Chaitophorus viminalis)]